MSKSLKSVSEKERANFALARVLNNGGQIEIKKDEPGLVISKNVFVRDCGIAVQGAADFLIKFCGYNRAVVI